MDLEDKQIGMLVADQFRDEEVFEPFDYLEEQGATVVLVGIQRGPVSGKLGGKVEAEKAIDEVSPEDFDALILGAGAAGLTAAIALMQTFQHWRGQTAIDTT